jgi:hypothetical protein
MTAELAISVFTVMTATALSLITLTPRWHAEEYLQVSAPFDLK